MGAARGDIVGPHPVRPPQSRSLSLATAPLPPNPVGDPRQENGYRDQAPQKFRAYSGIWLMATVGEQPLAGPYDPR